MMHGQKNIKIYIQIFTSIHNNCCVLT